MTAEIITTFERYLPGAIVEARMLKAGKARIYYARVVSPTGITFAVVSQYAGNFIVTLSPKYAALGVSFEAIAREHGLQYQDNRHEISKEV